MGLGMPTAEDVQQAQRALAGVTYCTPLQESGYVNDLIGTRVYFKLENLQRTGSFKLRGAYNRIRQLSAEELARGVVAASAGNHAQGVALAAGLVGTSAQIVMPKGASLTKVEATKAYGAEVVLAGDTFDDALEAAVAIQQESGRVLIPAFDDPWVIAGQGTVGLEIMDDRALVDVLVVPVGGGGLISGVALAAKARNPRVRVIGVQANHADAMVRSVAAGQIEAVGTVHTIADGIAVKRPGELTFRMVQQYVDDLVTVDEHDISRAIVIFLERSKLLVEGAGAVGLAALLAGKIAIGNRNVATVVSGGNIDVTLLNRIIEKGLVEEGRQVHVSTIIDDRPGQLVRLLDQVAKLEANVMRVHHERWDPSLAPHQVRVDLVAETRNAAHVDDLIAHLIRSGYHIDVKTPHLHNKNFDN
jgi:threonine dehydratase